MTDKPAPKGDTTSARRQDRRTDELNQKAQEFGFDGWRSMLTAIKNGTHIVVPSGQPAAESAGERDESWLNH